MGTLLLSCRYARMQPHPRMLCRQEANLPQASIVVHLLCWPAYFLHHQQSILLRRRRTALLGAAWGRVRPRGTAAAPAQSRARPGACRGKSLRSHPPDRPPLHRGAAGAADPSPTQEHHRGCTMPANNLCHTKQSQAATLPDPCRCSPGSADSRVAPGDRA
jgi:hypothetical protein